MRGSRYNSVSHVPNHPEEHQHRGKIMNRILVLIAVIAGLSGCSSVQQKTSTEKPLEKMEPLLLSYSAMDPAAQFTHLVAELRTVGSALQAYGQAHGGQLPPKLTDLVSQKYVRANGLVSSADPSAGKEGGVPNSYTEWGQATETDESGSSYLYEFSAAPCKWDWKPYLGDKPSAAEVDTNKDGAVSWAEVKGWQLLHGDTVQTPKNKPYNKNHFPVVRCYWYRYPDAYTNATGRTVLNLSADLKTVFVSQPWWEKDQ